MEAYPTNQSNENIAWPPSNQGEYKGAFTVFEVAVSTLKQTSDDRGSAEVAERYPYSTRTRAQGRRLTQVINPQSADLGHTRKSKSQSDEIASKEAPKSIGRANSQTTFNEAKKRGTLSQIFNKIFHKTKETEIQLTFHSSSLNLNEWRIAFEKQLRNYIHAYYEPSAEDILSQFWPPSLDLTSFLSRLTEVKECLDPVLFDRLQNIHNPQELHAATLKLKKKESLLVGQILGDSKVLQEICCEEERKYWLRRVEKLSLEMKIQKMEPPLPNLTQLNSDLFEELQKFAQQNIQQAPKQITLMFLEKLLTHTVIPKRIENAYKMGAHLYPFLKNFLGVFDLDEFQLKLNTLSQEETALMTAIIGKETLLHLLQLKTEKSSEWFGELEKNFCELQKDLLKTKFKERTKTVNLKASKFSEVKAKDIYEAYRAFYATCDGNFIQKSFTFNKKPLEKAPTLEKNEKEENKRIEKFMEWLLEQFYTVLNVPSQFTNVKRAPSKRVLHSIEKEDKVVQEVSPSLKQAEELLNAGITQNKDPSKLLKKLKNSIPCLLMLQCASNSAFPLAIELMQELVPHLWNPTDFTQVRLKPFSDDTIRFDFSYDIKERAYSVTQIKKFRLIKGKTFEFEEYGSLDVHCTIKGVFSASEDLSCTLNFEGITFDEKVPAEIINQIVELFFKL